MATIVCDADVPVEACSHSSGVVAGSGQRCMMQSIVVYITDERRRLFLLVVLEVRFSILWTKQYEN